MFPFLSTMFSLLALSPALTVVLANKYINVSESQPLVSPNVDITQQEQDQRELNIELHHKPQTNRDDVTYSNYRNKRDSAELEDGLHMDKRVRDFVGKRSLPEMYSSIPEPLMVTPVDSSDAVDFPLEIVIAPTGSSLYTYNLDGTENSNKDREEQVWNYKNKRLRDFVGKRSSSLNTGWGGSYDKRLRDFVGKRSVNDIQGDFIDKRLRDFVGKRDHSAYDEDILNEKRLREFVGKRSGRESIDDLVFFNGEKYFSGHTDTHNNNIDKRPREFVGKRNEITRPEDIEKRLRDFVGKRNEITRPEDIEKRLRDFVGKRNEITRPEDIEKRLRDFVGKRNEIARPEDIEKRLRDFVGKRAVSFLETPSRSLEKRLREFVGKRYGFDTFRDNKRAREFVGKREPSDLFLLNKKIREFIGKRADKRPRQFVGKRSLFFNDEEDKIEIAKKLRDFVGKRSDDGLYQEDKRLRDFVGKRSILGTDAVELSALKRLRDFVGKRDYVSDLDEREIVKRIREFVGKR